VKVTTTSGSFSDVVFHILVDLDPVDDRILADQCDVWIQYSIMKNRAKYSIQKAKPNAKAAPATVSRWCIYTDSLIRMAHISKRTFPINPPDVIFSESDPEILLPLRSSEDILRANSTKTTI
jgi:hypothetical protein